MFIYLIRCIITGFFLSSIIFGLKTITVKVYHVFESFGEEIQELKYSTIMNFNTKGLMIDSTIYTHTIPLTKKYVYISGEDEGLILKRTYDKEVVLSYQFEYDEFKQKLSTTLYGSNDSLYWKEYYKYDDNNFLYKQIRYDPKKAINTEMIGDNKDGKMIWAEQYVYNKNELRRIM